MIAIPLGEIKWGSPKSAKSEYSDLYYNDQRTSKDSGLNRLEEISFDRSHNKRERQEFKIVYE